MHQSDLAGLIVSVGVALVALALLAWQFAEQRSRDDDLSDEDAAHFRRQDRRRWLVAAVMLLLAAGVGYGSQLPPKVGGAANFQFVRLWIGIFLLVLLLFGLAVVDWFGTRRYAIRHRKHLLREGLEILRDDQRLRAQSARLNGDAHSLQEPDA